MNSKPFEGIILNFILGRIGIMVALKGLVVSVRLYKCTVSTLYDIKYNPLHSIISAFGKSLVAQWLKRCTAAITVLTTWGSNPR